MNNADNNENLQNRCCFGFPASGGIKCNGRPHCAVLPTANAGQYTNSNCEPLLFWFLCKWWYIAVKQEMPIFSFSSFQSTFAPAMSRDYKIRKIYIITTKLPQKITTLQ